MKKPICIVDSYDLEKAYTDDVKQFDNLGEIHNPTFGSQGCLCHWCEVETKNASFPILNGLKEIVSIRFCDNCIKIQEECGEVR